MILYIPFKMKGKIFFGKYICEVGNLLYLYLDGVLVARPKDRLEFLYARITRNEQSSR